MSDKEMVTIASKFPNGVRLHVQKRLRSEPEMPFDPRPMFEDLGWIDFAPYTPASATGPGVPAKAESFTSVDKELWEIWLKENAKNPMVTGGMVSVYEPPKAEEPEPAPGPEPQPEPEPTAVHDEHYRENFKDHAGQEGDDPPVLPVLRGKSKEEVDAGGKKV